MKANKFAVIHLLFSTLIALVLAFVVSNISFLGGSFFPEFLLGSPHHLAACFMLPTLFAGFCFWQLSAGAISLSPDEQLSLRQTYQQLPILKIFSLSLMISLGYSLFLSLFIGQAIATQNETLTLLFAFLTLIITPYLTVLSSLQGIYLSQGFSLKESIQASILGKLETPHLRIKTYLLLIGFFLFLTGLTQSVYLLLPAHFTVDLLVLGLSLVLTILFCLRLIAFVRQGLGVQESTPSTYPNLLIVCGLTLVGMVCFSSLKYYNQSLLEHKLQEVQHKIEHLKNSNFARPYPQASQPQNAILVYDKLLKGENQKNQALIKYVQTLTLEDDKIKADKSLEKAYQDQWRLLNEALASEQLKTTFDFKISSPMPELILAQAYAKGMVAIANGYMEDQDIETGLLWFIKCLRYGQDMSYTGTLIGTMIGGQVQKIAVSNLQPFLKSFNTAQLSTLASQLSLIAKYQITPRQALEYEVLLMQNSLTELEFALWPEATIGSSPLHKTLGFFIVAWVKPYLLFSDNLMNEYWDKMLHLATLPATQRKETMEEFKAFSESLGQKNMLLSLALPNHWSFAKRLSKHQAFFQGLRVQVALATYYAKNQSLPASLAQIELKPPALDPMSNQSFKFTPKAKQDYLLYSVGENGLDDHGDEENDWILND